MAIPAAPLNPLSRNVGNGAVELAWDASAGALSYNVYISTASGGPFVRANRATISDTKVRLPNLRFGITAYFKVTAVNADGESAQSSLAEDATCAQGVTTLQFDGLVGDQIPAGAVFAAMVGTKLVAFRTTTGGTCA